MINAGMKNEKHTGKYFEPQRYHRRPNSFDSLNSSSSDYDTHDWNIMDSKKSLELLNTSPDYPRKDSKKLNGIFFFGSVFQRKINMNICKTIRC